VYIDEMDHIKVKLMIAAMESLLTIEQSKRILTASKWGGFDAAMKSLARVSDQIVKAQQEKSQKAAYNEGVIIGLGADVKLQKQRAETTQSIYEAALVAVSA
jgi:hypothetical protein